MAKLGLLGALAGLGEGLQGMGKDMATRRAQALEDARNLAKEQRAQAAAEAREERQTELRVALHEDTQARLERGRERSIEALGERQDKSIAAQKEGRAEAFEQRKALIPITEASRKRVAEYSSQLSRSNSAFARAEAEKIKNGQIKDVLTAGRPMKRPDGTVRDQVLHVRGDGTLVETNQWVVPGAFKTASQKYGKPRGGGGSGYNFNPDDEDEEEDE